MNTYYILALRALIIGIFLLKKFVSCMVRLVIIAIILILFALGYYYTTLQ